MNRRSIFKKLDQSLGRAVSNIVRLLPVSRRADPQRILFARISGLGDAVIVLATIAQLRETNPSACIGVLTTPRVSEVFRGHPAVSELLVVDPWESANPARGIYGLVRAARGFRPGVFVDTEQYSTVTPLIGHLSGAGERIGFRAPRKPSGLFTRPVPYPELAHEIVSQIELVRAVNPAVSIPKRLSPIWVSDDQGAKAKDLLREVAGSRRPLVAFHIGSGPTAPERRWAPERYQAAMKAVQEKMGAQVLIVGTADEAPLAERVAAGVTPVPAILCGRTNLKSLCAVLGSCDLFIGNDSGPMHLAAAAGTPTIGIFGPNTPKRWGPYGPGNVGLWGGLDCSPCIKVHLGQFNTCGCPTCMEAVTVDQVVQTAEYLLTSIRRTENRLASGRLN